MGSDVGGAGEGVKVSGGVGVSLGINVPAGVGVSSAISVGGEVSDKVGSADPSGGGEGVSVSPMTTVRAGSIVGSAMSARARGSRLESQITPRSASPRLRVAILCGGSVHWRISRGRD